MVRLTRRARRAPGTPPRPPELDDRAQRLWRSFKGGIVGRKGETAVAQRLAELGLPALHDVLLPLDGGVTQIDHIVQLPAGIAVIETKAWSGVITGLSDDTGWRQSLDEGRVETVVINPLRQNRRHVDAVKACLAAGRIETPIVSHVVMTGRAELSPDLRDKVLDLPGLEALAQGALPAPPDIAALYLAWAWLVDAANKGEVLRPDHEAAIAAKSTR